ncbi:MAG: hypothetical protein AAF391_13120 [Bacteroidota bacterium]
MPSFQEASRMPAFILVLFVLNFIIFGAIYWYKANPVILWVGVSVLLIGIFLISIKLSLNVHANGISYQLFPFHMKEREIGWEQLDEAKLVRISALRDFGGWGLRYSGSHGWGYIMNGVWGLKISTKDGTKFVLSVKEQQQLRDFLKDENLEQYIVFEE